MAREFRLPDIGEGLTEAEIIRWLVAVGEPVEADQPIVEVETDKAVVEIPSPYAGVVLSHGGAEGDVVEVGEVLVTIGEPGEVAPPERASADPEEPADEESPRSARPEAAPIVGTLSEEAESLAPPTAEQTVLSTAVKALPIVRKLARDNDLDLDSIEGSGPGGRIVREDVEAVIAARAGAASGTSSEAPVEEVAVGSGATSVGGVRFDLKDEARLEQEALRLAVADARAKAEAMASGAGRTIDRILRVDEQGVTAPPMPVRIYREAQLAAADAAAPPISAGQMEIRAQVVVTAVLK